MRKVVALPPATPKTPITEAVAARLTREPRSGLRRASSADLERVQVSLLGPLLHAARVRCAEERISLSVGVSRALTAWLETPREDERGSDAPPHSASP